MKMKLNTQKKREIIMRIFLSRMELLVEILENTLNIKEIGHPAPLDTMSTFEIIKTLPIPSAPLDTISRFETVNRLPIATEVIDTLPTSKGFIHKVRNLIN